MEFALDSACYEQVLDRLLPSLPHKAAAAFLSALPQLTAGSEQLARALWPGLEAAASCAAASSPQLLAAMQVSVSSRLQQIDAMQPTHPEPVGCHAITIEESALVPRRPQPPETASKAYCLLLE